VTAFAAIKWAREAPVVRRADGKPDSTAHHVLLTLATYADKEGRARPSVAALADATTLADDTVMDALRRLEDAALIKSEGAYGGTGPDVWVLAMDTVRSDGDGDPLGRRARQRAATAARVARHRARLKAVTVSEGVTEDLGNGAGDRDVTVRDTVTPDPVTVSEGVSNGVGGRYVTVPDTVSNGADCVTSAGPGLRTAIELPVELPMNCHPFPAETARARNTYPADFEAFWTAYGRKGAKRTAAAEWARATKRAPVPVIMAAVAPYVASTPNPKFRKDAERWLKGDCWESAIVPLQPAAGDYRPYRNPTDQSVYDEDF
jgi:hypothetical protein